MGPQNSSQENIEPNKSQAQTREDFLEQTGTFGSPERMQVSAKNSFIDVAAKGNIASYG